jgi:hypothetical protein
MEIRRLKVFMCFDYRRLRGAVPTEFGAPIGINSVQALTLDNFLDSLRVSTLLTTTTPTLWSMEASVSVQETYIQNPAPGACILGSSRHVDPYTMKRHPDSLCRFLYVVYISLYICKSVFRTGEGYWGRAQLRDELILYVS